jgi:hypothetical protein
MPEESPGGWAINTTEMPVTAADPTSVFKGLDTDSRPVLHRPTLAFGADFTFSPHPSLITFAHSHSESSPVESKVIIVSALISSLQLLTDSMHALTVFGLVSCNAAQIRLYSFP